MAYIALVIAWVIMVAPWGFFIYSLWNAMNGKRRWTFVTFLVLFLLPLYYAVIHQLVVDFAQ